MIVIARSKFMARFLNMWGSRGKRTFILTIMTLKLLEFLSILSVAIGLFAKVELKILAGLSHLLGREKKTNEGSVDL